MTPANAALSPLQTAPRTFGISKIAGYNGASMEKITEKAKEFEAQFITQMLSSMFSTLDVTQSLGGSEEEETFQSFMVQEYGKIISRTGGIGITDQISRAMLHMQEVGARNATPSA